MKTLLRTTFKHARLALALGVALLLPFMLASCVFPVESRGDDHNDHDHSRGDDHSSHGDYFYSCSMHHDVRRSEPGNCPRCGMRLDRMQERGNDGHDHDNNNGGHDRRR